MIQPDKIIFHLKRSLLEYGLKYRLDYLVQRFSCDENTIFNDLRISSIRFELYNLYIVVKHKKFNLFEPLIGFLNVFNTQFPSILDEKLFLRVLVSLKALCIYDCLRSGDLKSSSKLIKEYFPDTGVAFNIASSNKDKSVKATLEFKILKLRSEWNELIINKNKRELFFKTQFHLQYDEQFLNFLLKKVNVIIDIINQELPLTQIEELMQNQYKQANLILFDVSDIQLELEDEVRVQLFIDNLRLHKLSLDVSNENQTYLTKYIKKNFKILIEWQSDQNSSLQLPYSQTTSDSMGGSSIIHDVLYLDSQFCNLQTTDETDLNAKSPNVTRLVTFGTEIENITNDLTTGQSMTFVSALNSFDTSKERKKVRNIISASELITDDEKEQDTSI